MWSTFQLTVSLLVTALHATSLDTLNVEKRQANSAAVSSTDFRRRGYASIGVLNQIAYIDGGEFSYNQAGTTEYQYSSSLIAIDLSNSWTNSSVVLNAISKPTGVPDLVSGGIWVDHIDNLIYIGFSGRPSIFGDGANQTTGLWSFKPDGTVSGGQWVNMNHSADTTFMTNQRMYSPLVANGGGAGYALGGFISEITSSNVPAPGLLSFNYTTHVLTNSTVTGSNVIVGGYDQMGGMVQIPQFGEAGILVAIGGDRFKNGGDHFNDMSYVTVYDTASSTWIDVLTTGDIPQSRKEFCMAAVPNPAHETIEILVYAGWNGNLGPESVPYDEAYVLTIPAFNWFKAEYPANNPRHGLSCTAVGGGQILTVGGLDTTQDNAQTVEELYTGVFDTPDPFTNGLAIFNMNEMAFADIYEAKPGSYTGAQTVLDYYASNPRTPTSIPTALSSVLAISGFALRSPSASATPTPTPPVPAHHTSAGVIAGCVVGGIAGLAILAFGIFWLLRQRRRRKLPSELDPKESRAELMADPIHSNYSSPSYHSQRYDGCAHVPKEHELSASAVQEDKLGGGARGELPTTGHEVHELP